MSDIKYSITIPYNPDPSDRLTKVQVYGNLKEGAQQFSINFVDDPKSLANITYHFKVKLPEQTLIENHKYNDNWGNEKRRQLNLFDGKNDKTMCNLSDIRVAIDVKFTEYLQYEFNLDYTEDTIRVYKNVLDGFNFVTSYNTYNSLSDIKSIQVWGDVAKITRLLLSYENEQVEE